MEAVAKFLTAFPLAAHSPMEMRTSSTRKGLAGEAGRPLASHRENSRPFGPPYSALRFVLGAHAPKGRGAERPSCAAWAHAQRAERSEAFAAKAGPKPC